MFIHSSSVTHPQVLPKKRKNKSVRKQISMSSIKGIIINNSKGFFNYEKYHESMLLNYI